VFPRILKDFCDEVERHRRREVRNNGIVEDESLLDPKLFFFPNLDLTGLLALRVWQEKEELLGIPLTLAMVLSIFFSLTAISGDRIH